MRFLNSKNALGFTLIELLVVISIIGLLAAVVLVSLNSARAKSRDARRVSDMHQVQTALELYYNSNGGYPPATGGSPDTTKKPDGSAGASPTRFQDYMLTFPANPTPNGSTYTYKQVGAGGAAYSVDFNLEGVTGSLPAGAHCVTPTGISNAVCP